MAIITIPKKLTKKDDLIVIPRKEYEALLLKQFREFRPTVTQRKALRRAESNLQRGTTLSYHELVKKLGFTN